MARIQNRRQPRFSVVYKDKQSGEYYPDLTFVDDVTNRVIQSIHTVHRALGPGFLSQVYRRATRIELGSQLIPFEYLKELPLIFESQHLSTLSTRLFLIEGCIILAAIAATAVTTQHTEKLRWAMPATQARLGIIANFYPSRPEIRFLRTSPEN